MAGRWSAAILFWLAVAARAERIQILSQANADPLEALAAQELRTTLSQAFPEHDFVPDVAGWVEGPSIVVGTLARNALLRKIGAVEWAAKQGISKPESYIIKTFHVAGRKVVAIGGADGRGTLYGAYTFLEKLGCGFYLSYEVCGGLGPGADPLPELEVADSPVVSERAVLDWHNFPSSCSTWNLEDWKTYIRRSMRMKFNSLVVHLYGNNPIFAYSHNGIRKPVEGLTTSLRGREWGTQNVNDVRRLIGAAGIFSAPVFGSEAAMVPDERRTEAATELMQRVFAFARSRGMEVNLAVDVDTESALPRNIVDTLPERARFPGWNQYPIPNPEVPEGYAFYRSQVRFLLAHYPTLTRLTLWKRVGRTPASQVDPQNLPEAWRPEFEKLAKGLAGDQRQIGAGHLVVNHMARAFRRALQELGRPDIPLGVGTWHIEFMEIADRFFDPALAFYALDGTRRLPEEATRRMMRSCCVQRSKVTFAWAHHDDATYAGRPFTPFANYAGLLESSGSAGYGVIHWTWRPLDLFFKSLAQQVWKHTVNEPLRTTAEEMAARTFGAAARQAGGRYLERWVQEAPQFGRETSNFFMDPDYFTDELSEQVLRGSEERLAELARLRPLVGDTEVNKSSLAYFEDWEEYVRRLHSSGRNLTRARRAYENGDLAASIRLLSEHPVERVVEQFADAARRLPVTPGEQGLLLSLNTRFYPYSVMLRQLARAEPIRFRFLRYEHSALAQGPGRGLFYFDRARNLWYSFLIAEDSQSAIVFPRYFEASGVEELYSAGFASDQEVNLRIGIPLDYWYFTNPKAKGKTGNTPLTNGDYLVRLYFIEPDSRKTGERLFHVDLQGARVLENFDIAAAGGGRRNVAKSFPVRVTDGFLHLKLVPVREEVVLCGLVLDPR